MLLHPHVWYFAFTFRLDFIYLSFPTPYGKLVLQFITPSPHLHFGTQLCYPQLILVPSPAHPVTHWAAPRGTICQIPLPLLWKGTRNCHSLLPFFWEVLPFRKPLPSLPWQIIFPKKSGRGCQEPFRNPGRIHEEEYYLPRTLAESFKNQQWSAKFDFPLTSQRLTGGLILPFHCWLKSCQNIGVLARELKFAVCGRHEVSPKLGPERIELVIHAQL